MVQNESAFMIFRCRGNTGRTLHNLYLLGGAGGGGGVIDHSIDAQGYVQVIYCCDDPDDHFIVLCVCVCVSIGANVTIIF